MDLKRQEIEYTSTYPKSCINMPQYWGRLMHSTYYGISAYIEGKYIENQGYLLDFKCRKDLALIIHDNYQKGPFQTRDISKRLKSASTSPGLPYHEIIGFIKIMRFPAILAFLRHFHCLVIVEKRALCF